MEGDPPVHAALDPRDSLLNSPDDPMTLSPRAATRTLFALLWIGSAGLILAGCDSGGTDPPDPTAFTVTVENVGSAAPILKSGAFNTPTGAGQPGPIAGGDSYQFTFTAGPNEIPDSGMRLSFATMFIQSNDLYYAFEPEGLALFENGTPIGQNGPADVTDQVNLYDAGTEVDQKPGAGADQAPRQGEVGGGMAENGSVVEVTNMDPANDSLENDGFSYPPTSDVLSVSVSSEEDEASGGYTFTVTIQNEGTTVNGAPVPLSPGAYAVHWAQTPAGDAVTYPGHTPGAPASDGIERIAEDGAPAGADGVPGNHVQQLSTATGVAVPLSPGGYAVHTDQATVFETNEPAPTGIERVAEDGTPMELVSMLSGASGISSAGAFNTPSGADNPGPIGPGGSYSFMVEAVPGDRLSLATMHVQSNDLFYAFAPSGLALFNESNRPVSGDVTDQVRLYDAGTEGDQEPGVGLDQAPRQTGSDTGPPGEGRVERVDGSNDGYSYPAPNNTLRVTITPPSQSQ